MSQFDIVFGGTPSQNVDVSASGGNPWGYDEDGIPIYVDPSIMIALDPTNPAHEGAYTSFRTRLLQAGTECINMTQTGQTYASTVADFTSIPSHRRNLPMMLNLEFPWLTILGKQDSDTVSSEDRNSGPVEIEIARYNAKYGTTFTKDTATTAQLKAVAQELWKDTTQYVLTNGARKVVHHGASGMNAASSASLTFGIPLMSVAANPGPTNTIEYYAPNPPSFPSFLQAQTLDSTKAALASLIKATSGSSGWAPLSYSFFPTNGISTSEIAKWTDGSLLRRVNNANQTEPPNYMSEASYKEWMEQHVRGVLAHSNAAIDIVIAENPDLADDLPPRLSPIIWTGQASEIVAEYIIKHHYMLQDTDPEERSDILYGSMFQNIHPLDTETPVIPDEVWVWDAARYYDYTLLTTNFYSVGTPYVYRMEVLLMRYAFERACINRPVSPIGSPIGDSGTTNGVSAFARPTSPAVPDGSGPTDTTQGGTHWNWLYNNTLPESPWYRSGSNRFPASTVWHHPVDGSQLPGGLTLVGGALAPYLNFSEVVNGSHVEFAWLQCTTENRVKQVERLRTKINEYLETL